MLSEIHARRYRAVVLEDKADGLLVGMADPTDIYSFDELRNLLKRPIKQAVVQEADLMATIETMKALAGEIKGFTGIDDPYEAPFKPEIHLHSDQQSLEEEVNEILNVLRDRGIINQ